MSDQGGYVGDLNDPELLAKGPAECLECGITFATLGEWKNHLPDCRSAVHGMTTAEIEAAYEKALQRGRTR